ncbi:hypothetical protein HS99_0005365 [Kitasatospora aureofaciens]|uniref:Uncharacterized protein n=1 Tax=Kitasatospora aureofaciens TaxID=1894 RepID=A0A1E7N966_KITAU|nr:hypothetical protein HS99_0005365 [Kitasatospora aureofaciens]GGU96050.1 hypothetical protein GCM10010502_57530 [Kitasatospora aureofaciens]
MRRPAAGGRPGLSRVRGRHGFVGNILLLQNLRDPATADPRVRGPFTAFLLTGRLPGWLPG